MAGVPFALRMCDTAVQVAGFAIQYLRNTVNNVARLLGQIKSLKAKPTKSLHAMMTAFDMSKNAAGYY